MHTVRSVSGHVSPTRYLKPIPLGSARITGPHHYYGYLRLPANSVDILAVQACLSVRTKCTPIAGSPWLLYQPNVKLDADLNPGKDASTCPDTH